MFGLKTNADDESIENLAKKIQEEIAEIEPKIEQWLKDHGYNIISRDTRTFWRSYTVIKGTELETKKDFTFNEMKTIINL